MQVTETLSEGLKREFKVVVPAAELDAKVNARLDEIKERVRINGFRPGKVPVAHLKRLYGRSVAAETIEQLIRDTNAEIFTERGFKLATDKDVTLESRFLVNAVGAWANEIAGFFGEAIPLLVGGPPQFVTAPVPFFIGSVIKERVR